MSEVNSITQQPLCQAHRQDTSCLNSQTSLWEVSADQEDTDETKRISNLNCVSDKRALTAYHMPPGSDNNALSRDGMPEACQPSLTLNGPYTLPLTPPDPRQAEARLLLHIHNTQDSPDPRQAEARLLLHIHNTQDSPDPRQAEARLLLHIHNTQDSPDPRQAEARLLLHIHNTQDSPDPWQAEARLLLHIHNTQDSPDPRQAEARLLLHIHNTQDSPDPRQAKQAHAILLCKSLIFFNCKGDKLTSH
ncbi:hypothetical protein P7K49_018160 [Saguinus oedipus]|uniref:Uncharacterized protein n=1 Tax=Saguinus oedipus TaxID=9490 RepID=A0ABQ9V5Q4_SAGOE|nr:hypothetical protein P7K49_018160 [Saguinus oedipus]